MKTLITRTRNRIRKLKRGNAYSTFLGVFWALVAYKAVLYALVLVLK